MSHSLPRLGCRAGTFSPSHRQMRSTRLSLTSQPAARRQGGDPPVPIATVPARQLDDVGREPRFVIAAPRRLALRRTVLTERRADATLGDGKLPPHMLDAERADARGLPVSRGSLLQDELVQREIRHRPA